MTASKNYKSVGKTRLKTQ